MNTKKTRWITCLSVALLSQMSVVSLRAQSVPDGFPVTDGLSLYLDAEAVDLEGERVTRMIDRSGRGNDAWEIVPEGPSMPVLLQAATPAGLDAIGFDGHSNYLEISANSPLLDGRARTTLVVFRANTFGVGRIVNSAFSSLNPDDPEAPAIYSVHGLFANTGGVLRLQNRNASAGSESLSTQNGAIAEGNFYVGANLWLDDGYSVVSVRDANDQRFVSQTEGPGADAVPTGHIWTRVGANGSYETPEAADFFDGDVAAVLVYNRALDPLELEAMEEYLRGLYLTGEVAPSEVNNPAVTDGLVVHLNSSNVQATGSVIEQVFDTSGYNNHAVSQMVGEAVVRPAPLLSSSSTPSGRAALLFNGADQYLQISANPTDFDGNGKTSLVVFRVNEPGNGRLINSAYSTLDPSNPNAPARYSVHSIFSRPVGDVRIQNRTLTGGAISTSTESGVVDTGNFFIGGNIWLPTGEQVALARNAAGERFVTQGDGATGIPTGHLWTRIGANSAANSETLIDFFNGEIAAVVVYNRALEPDELLQVEEYLQSRYLESSGGLSYQDWLAEYILPGDQLAPEDNPAGDGVPNLVKYALGMDPTVADRTGLPTISLESVNSDEYLEIRVERNASATEVELVPEVSSDLVEWHSGSEHVEILVDDPGILHARDRQPLGSAGRRFMRINVLSQE